MTMNPPICSLASAKGPSVMSTSLSFTRTIVATLGGCSAPLKTHAPAALISLSKTATSRMTFARNSGGGRGPTGSITLSK